jgi:hypothetical protein
MFYKQPHLRCRKPRLTAVGIRCADHATPSTGKRLALTSQTSGGRSVGIVRLRTTATEFSLVLGTSPTTTTLTRTNLAYSYRLLNTGHVLKDNSINM